MDITVIWQYYESHFIKNIALYIDIHKHIANGKYQDYILILFLFCWLVIYNFR